MNLEVLDQCPICQHDKFTFHVTCQDYLVSNETFQIQQCVHCHFLFTNPRPAAETIGRYYQSDQYISHNDEKQGLVSNLYKTVRRYTLNQKAKLIKDLNGQVGSLLDIGCGTGAFLEYCQQKGWRIQGVEPDSGARLVASKRLNISVAAELATQTESETSDVVTLWHVLEHIPDLQQTLERIHQHITKNGTLLLALPNHLSWDAAKYRQWWAAYDVPRHLSHFSPKTITSLVEQQGFKRIKMIPMPFDAYYIAMLSTQHRDGKINYAESLLNGFRSNLNAARTGNYSSLTYVFKKV